MTERTIEERFDAQQVISMAQRLTISEIEALGESTELREAGLRHAHQGDLGTASRLILSARQNRDLVNFDDEAATMFETYQLAAEAYIDFRQARFSDAEGKMRMSIAQANRLRRAYGYLTELRRVHLGANLLKISVAATDYAEAVTSGFRLIEYVKGNAEAWPWSELELPETDVLSGEEKLFVLRQIFKPTAETLLRLHVANRGDSMVGALSYLAAASAVDPIEEAVTDWAINLVNQLT